VHQRIDTIFVSWPDVIKGKVIKPDSVYRLSYPTTPCLKKWATFIFTITSAKWTKFNNFFHCQIQEGFAGKVGIKTTTSPQIC